MTHVPPMVKWTAAVVAGGGIAGLTHGMTGLVRAHFTVLTGGLGNVIIATMELGGALSITFLAFVAPIAAVALIVGILLLMSRPPAAYQGGVFKRLERWRAVPSMRRIQFRRFPSWSISICRGREY